VAGMWIFLFRTRAGFALQVGGLAPAASSGIELINTSCHFTFHPFSLINKTYILSEPILTLHPFSYKLMG